MILTSWDIQAGILRSLLDVFPKKTHRITQNGSKKFDESNIPWFSQKVSHYIKFDVKQNSQGHFSHKTPPFLVRPLECFNVFVFSVSFPWTACRLASHVWAWISWDLSRTWKLGGKKRPDKKIGETNRAGCKFAFSIGNTSTTASGFIAIFVYLCVTYSCYLGS